MGPVRQGGPLLQEVHGGPTGYGKEEGVRHRRGSNAHSNKQKQNKRHQQQQDKSRKQQQNHKRKQKQQQRPGEMLHNAGMRTFGLTIGMLVNSWSNCEVSTLEATAGRQGARNRQFSSASQSTASKNGWLCPHGTQCAQHRECSRGKESQDPSPLLRVLGTTVLTFASVHNTTHLDFGGVSGTAPEALQGIPGQQLHTRNAQQYRQQCRQQYRQQKTEGSDWTQGRTSSVEKKRWMKHGTHAPRSAGCGRSEKRSPGTLACRAGSCQTGPCGHGNKRAAGGRGGKPETNNHAHSLSGATETATPHTYSRAQRNVGTSQHCQIGDGNGRGGGARTRPVSISYSKAPKDHQSTARPCPERFKISGAARNHKAAHTMKSTPTTMPRA